MKIGLVCPYHMFKGGGVQECVSAMHEELTRRGHNVKIITPMPRDYEGPVPAHIVTIGTSANVKSFFNTQTQFSATVDTEAIDKLLAEENFDILHFHEPVVPVLSRQLLTRSQSTNIATSHAKLPDRVTSKTIANIFTPYARGLLKYIHAYSAVSEPAAEYIRTFTDETVRIIPNGIDIAKYAPKHEPLKHKSTKTILYVGRLEKRKGLKHLLQAFLLLAEHQPHVQLLIAGMGPEEESLRAYVSEYDIPRVTFLGYVDDKEKIAKLQRADLFCSAAHYGESFGIVLLEAMAAGTPIVAGDNPGYETVMQGRGRLSLVNSLDSVDFARRLELLLYDDTLRQAWRDWAKETVQQYDYKNVVDQYEALYEYAIRRRG